MMQRRSFIRNAAAAVFGTLAMLYAPTMRPTIGAAVNRWMCKQRGNWSDGRNWSLGRPPLIDDVVLFEGSAKMDIPDAVSRVDCDGNDIDLDTLIVSEEFRGSIGRIDCPLTIDGANRIEHHGSGDLFIETA